MLINWQVQLFGGLIVRQLDGTGAEGNEIRIESRKAASLLAILAYHRGRSFARDVLAEQLWPGEDLDPIRDRFRQALAALKRTLEAGTAPGSVIVADRLEVRLNPDVVQTDVAAFLIQARANEREETAAQDRKDALLQAANLYRGELLAGFYDDWIFPERTQLAQHYQGICSRLALQLAVEGQMAEALTYSQRAAQSDPAREDIQRLLMRLYVAAGRRPEALRQYRELERILRGDNLSPSEETSNLLTFLQTCSPANALNGLTTNPVNERKSERETLSVEVSPADTAAKMRFFLEPDGGAVPLDSAFYLERPPDTIFYDALQRQDSIVLVKGSRLIGKTSLLARGLQRARRTQKNETAGPSSSRVVLTDFQKLTADQLESPDTLFFTLAEMITERLELDVSVESLWNPARGWNVNFERFMRRSVLGTLDGPLVWGLDEVDRLFGYSYRSEVFGLFRAWHNERALDPDGPWSRLTLAIAYATEAHLFITDLNQSPFNVGTRLVLEDFTLTDVADLNRRYGSPLRDAKESQRFYDLVGGHPYLVRRGLRVLAEKERTLTMLEVECDREDGVYGDHLLRLLGVLRPEPDLCDAVRKILSGGDPMSINTFYRLRSAGVIVGSSPQDTRLRCQLYRRFLDNRLP